MSRSSSTALAFGLSIAACTATEAGSAPPAATPPGPAPARTWKQIMKQVDAHCDVLDQALGGSLSTDLRAAADAAAQAALLLRLGYGRYEDPQVPGFARMAREAESWLLQVGLEARQAHGDIARELFRGGAHHCKQCHDAHDQVHG